MKLSSTFLYALPLFLVISCNKTEQKPALINASEQAKQDSISKQEAKKKAQKEEMAKLPKPYHPDENAENKLSELVKTAQKEHKNIMIQAGGNWCIWCLRFNQYVQTTPELKNLVDQNYLYYHLNYSPENKNEKIFKKFGNPGEEYGYPVFIVLDENGNTLHIQDSAVLEEGNGYSLEKVKSFFEKWKPNSKS